jgi:hypothetical protein
MKVLYTLALVATLTFALGAAAEPLEKPGQPATPVFLAGVDSGGAGAGIDPAWKGEGLFLRGSCADVVGICACVADGSAACSGAGCQLTGAQGCQLK